MFENAFPAVFDRKEWRLAKGAHDAEGVVSVALSAREVMHQACQLQQAAGCDRRCRALVAKGRFRLVPVIRRDTTWTGVVDVEVGAAHGCVEVARVAGECVAGTKPVKRPGLAARPT